MHEGELAKVSGEWVPYDVETAIGVPIELCQPQFAWNGDQWKQMKVLAGVPPQPKFREQRKCSPTKHVTMGELEAIGETRVLRPPTRGTTWETRSAKVVSFPLLLYELGVQFTSLHVTCLPTGALCGSS